MEKNGLCGCKQHSTCDRKKQQTPKVRNRRGGGIAVIVAGQKQSFQRTQTGHCPPFLQIYFRDYKDQINQLSRDMRCLLCLVFKANKFRRIWYDDSATSRYKGLPQLDTEQRGRHNSGQKRLQKWLLSLYPCIYDRFMPPSLLCFAHLCATPIPSLIM